MSHSGDIPLDIGQKAGWERALSRARRSTLVKASEVVFPSSLPADEGKCLHDAETKRGGSDVSSCNSSSGPTWHTDICIGSTPARCHGIEAIERHELPHNYHSWVHPLLDELQQASPRCRSISQMKGLTEMSARQSAIGILRYSSKC